MGCLLLTTACVWTRAYVSFSFGHVESCQCSVRPTCVWLLCVDKMFWYPCPVHFLSVQKTAYWFLLKATFLFDFFFLSYTFNWTVWNCDIGFVYTARFSSLFLWWSSFVLWMCSSSFFLSFFLICSFYSQPFLSLSDWEALNYVSVVQASCRYEGNFSERDLL